MSRITCISFCNIDWYIVHLIRLDFYYIYIIYNKFITFLSYFENFDFRYLNNFLRIGFFGLGLKIGIDLRKHII